MDVRNRLFNFTLPSCLLAVLLVLTGCSNDKMELISEDIVIEYGQTISTDIKDYLLNDDNELLSNVIIKNIPENEKDKDYPAIGEYVIELVYEELTENVNVSIKDTTAPEFVELQNRYETEFDTSLKTNIFKATDLSNLGDDAITLDDSDVDYKKAGEYQATVIVKDASGNETKKQITVVVKENVVQGVKDPINISDSSTNDAYYPSFSINEDSASTVTNDSDTSGYSELTEYSENDLVDDQNTMSTVHYEYGNSMKLFNSEDEAIAYGDQYMMENVEKIGGYSYWSTGDKWTVEFRYR